VHHSTTATNSCASSPTHSSSYAVMGMDWHSSGTPTSVIGALKRALALLQSELGIYVRGGRGKHSRKTPASGSTAGRLRRPAGVQPRWTALPSRMALNFI
jgi:uncharacterized protein